ncbi:hypothetical protein [Fibrella arboris]|uniref:hypothetical protein n=1 Tax=Fibrella arboris TaxID=3242486 RepID=UPI003520C5AA
MAALIDQFKGRSQVIGQDAVTAGALQFTDGRETVLLEKPGDALVYFTKEKFHHRRRQVQLELVYVIAQINILCL